MTIRGLEYGGALRELQSVGIWKREISVSHPM